MSSVDISDPAVLQHLRESFYRDGFVVLRGLVPDNMTLKVLRLVNAAINEQPTLPELVERKKGNWCPKVGRSKAVKDLFNRGGVKRVVEALIGTQVSAIQAGQIALRFPGTLCTNKRGFKPVPQWDKYWHIDGFNDEKNQARGNIRNFTTLCGVSLSDQPTAHCGNLVVFPQSHHHIESYFNINGFEDAKEQGLYAVKEIKLRRPQQLTTKRGDVIICHYQLAHSIAPNASPNIRYQVYFRVNQRKWHGFHPECMLNIWKDYPAMAEVRAEFNRNNLLDLSVKDDMVQMNAGYADALAASFLDEPDSKRGRMHDQVIALFDQRQFQACQPLFLALLACSDEEDEEDGYKEEIWLLVKAAVCFTHAPNCHNNTVNLQHGEGFVRAALEQSPNLPHAIHLLTVNMLKQGPHRREEIGPLLSRLYACPRPREGKAEDIKRFAVGGIENAVKAGVDPNVMAVLLHEACEKYPEYATEIRNATSAARVRTTALWEEGKAWMHAPPNAHRNRLQHFQNGLRIFSGIADLDSKDYWANAVAGNLSFHAKRIQQSLGYLQCAQAVNAQNQIHAPIGLMRVYHSISKVQHRDTIINLGHSICMTDCKFDQNNVDHWNQLGEMLSILQDTMGKGNPQLQQFQVNLMQKVQLPQARAHIIKKSEEKCVIM